MQSITIQLSPRIQAIGQCNISTEEMERFHQWMREMNRIRKVLLTVLVCLSILSLSSATAPLIVSWKYRHLKLPIFSMIHCWHLSISVLMNIIVYILIHVAWKYTLFATLTRVCLNWTEEDQCLWRLTCESVNLSAIQQGDWTRFDLKHIYRLECIMRFGQDWHKMERRYTDGGRTVSTVTAQSVPEVTPPTTVAAALYQSRFNRNMYFETELATIASCCTSKIFSDSDSSTSSDSQKSDEMDASSAEISIV